MSLIGRPQGGPREGSVPGRSPLEATVTTAPQLHRSSTPTLQTPGWAYSDLVTHTL